MGATPHTQPYFLRGQKVGQKAAPVLLLNGTRMGIRRGSKRTRPCGTQTPFALPPLQIPRVPKAKMGFLEPTAIKYIQITATEKGSTEE